MLVVTDLNMFPFDFMCVLVFDDNDAAIGMWEVACASMSFGSFNLFFFSVVLLSGNIWRHSKGFCLDCCESLTVTSL